MSVSCEEGFRASSPEPLTCEMSGNWSRPLPTCQGIVHRINKLTVLDVMFQKRATLLQYIVVNDKQSCSTHFHCYLFKKLAENCSQPDSPENEVRRLPNTTYLRARCRASQRAFSYVGNSGPGEARPNAS